MVAARDPHLRAEQPVEPVVLRLGPGRDIRQRRPGLGLREAHRPEEAPVDHRRDEPIYLLIGVRLASQEVGRQPIVSIA